MKSGKKRPVTGKVMPAKRAQPHLGAAMGERRGGLQRMFGTHTERAPRKRKK